MSQQRLNGLAMCYIERNMLDDNIDLDIVIEDCVNKCTKVSLLVITEGLEVCSHVFFLSFSMRCSFYDT
jgi:hypothetical protein